MSIIQALGKPTHPFRTCPICGGPDWCGVIVLDNGGYLIACQRNKEKTDTIGKDGNSYVWIKESKSGASNIYEELSQRMARVGKSNNGTFEQYKEQHAKALPMAEKVEPLYNSKLDKIYRKLLSMLVLEDEHKQHLIEEGWTEEMITASGVKSFPVDDYHRKQNFVMSKNPKRYELAKVLYEKFGDLTGVPGACIKENSKGKYWTLVGPSGIFFPIPDMNKNIYRLRIRLDNPPMKNGKIVMKYGNFSSYKEEIKDGMIINYYTNGTQSGNALGVYYKDQDDFYIAYATEGEKKGIVSNYILNKIIIDIPGVNSFSLLLKVDPETGKRPVDFLKEKGTQVIIIAFDADKTINMAVLEAEKNTVELLKKEGFTIGIGEWDISWGKGLDNILLKNYRPKYKLAL